MKKKDNNFYQKTHENGLKNIRFNKKELAVLNDMMKNDGWENTSGFIKYKLFGMSLDRKYINLFLSKEKKDAEALLLNAVDEFHRDIQYCGYRYDTDARELAKRLIETEGKKGMTKTLSRKISMLAKWHSDIMEATKSLDEDITLLMRTMGLNVPEKDEDYYHNLPDYVLESAVEDWNNTTSPEAQEQARRFALRWEKEHGRTLDGVTLKNDTD